MEEEDRLIGSTLMQTSSRYRDERVVIALEVLLNVSVVSDEDSKELLIHRHRFSIASACDVAVLQSYS